MNPMKSVGVVAVLLVACRAAGPSSFAVAYADGQRAESAGRWSEAAIGFDRAATEAVDDRHKEDALYLAALARIRAGNVAGGGQQLVTISGGHGDHAADASLAHALLLMSTHDPGAETELDTLVRRFPGNGLAPRALALRLRLEDDKGVDAALTYLATLEAPLAATEVGADVIYQEALRVEAKGDLERAHAMYVDVATRWPYPGGALFDDALWRASLIADKRGDPKLAAADLEQMLEVREESQFNGSYDRPRFPESMIRLARVYEGGLHDDAHARETWQRFASTFTRSPKVDLAMWNDARLAQKSGDSEGACSTLAALVDRFPDSRYVPCAVSRCNKVTRPKESHAPSDCHAYIEREP